MDRAALERLDDATLLVMHRQIHEIMEQRSFDLKSAFLSQCKGKDKYPTFALAEKKARNLRKIKVNREPYKCPHCHQWHVG